MKRLSLALLALVTALVAEAHVPFLKPNQFNVTHHRLTIESAFTEFPFQADFAMDSPNFTITSPAGEVTAIKPIAKTKAAVYLEPELKEEGSYRISTGQRVGPVYKAVETPDKKLYFAADMKRVSGKPTTMNYYSYADTYIFKGQQKYKPVPLNKGLEIIPLASPNGVQLGGELSLQVLEHGKPVPNARIIVVTDNEHFSKRRMEDLYDVENVRPSNLHANQQGEFTFKPQKAGLNFLFVTVHHQLNEHLWESLNASLTLEVNLPPETANKP
ncbi:DUF4198 domain-containing protein [Methylophilus glucosoxydans]|uniref:DUF4198 domain-containing protein n=1 Tax=Methylophilus glucosoxydans TaxID=752553 RepID=A0ABW3GJ01_9PROT